MRKLFTTFLFFFILTQAFSQSILFTEGFESQPGNVTSSGTPGWAVNSRLQTNGLNCDSSFINLAGDISYLETNSFDCTGMLFVFLNFNTICKVEFFDGGIIEYSIDNGNSWTPLIDNDGNPGGNNNCIYLGDGFFRNQGSKFQEANYATWQAGLNLFPDSSWWKAERFDVSQALANEPNVKLRFTLADLNNNGGIGLAGWYIDDIEVLGSPCEIYYPAPVAEFYSNYNYICNTTDVTQFTNVSVNAATYLWDFGDGNFSTLENPNHIYSTAGTYSVTLIASPATICDFSDTIVKADYIVVANTGEPIAPNCFPATINYCCNYGITKVEFGSILNNSGVGDSYQNYSCNFQTTMIAGNTYFLDIQTGSYSNVKAWIDYDNDGVLNDITELVFESNNQLLSHQTFINTNLNATLNTPLRFRITSDQASTPITGSCMQPERGQTEDYAIIFTENLLSPVADLTVNDTVVIEGTLVQFYDISLNAPTSWSWIFPGGTPSSSSVQSPTVLYDSAGVYNVTLIASNAFGSDSITYSDYINVMNYVFMCSNDTVVSYESGMLYDSGGPFNNYQLNESCTLLIDIPCANSITLTFNSLNFNPSFFWGTSLSVYDGVNITDPLLISIIYSGGMLPAPVTSTGGAILIIFQNDFMQTGPGFEIAWSSTLGSSSQITAAYSISDSNPPIATMVQFTDNSNNDPVAWYWDFGDGASSTLQNPQHFYNTSGLKNITLIVSNCETSDTIIQTINVQEPPIISVIPDNLNLTLACGDSTLVQLVVVNNGVGQLVLNIDSAVTYLSSGPAKILASTSWVDINSIYPNTINAINQHFQDYTLSQVSPASASVLQDSLKNKDILLFPSFSNNHSQTVTTWGPTLSSFVNEGGRVIICGNSQLITFENTGLININSSFNATGKKLEIEWPQHPLVDSVITFNNATSKTFAYDSINSDFRTIVSYQNRAVVGYRPVGNGKVIYTGTDLSVQSPEASQIIGNAVRWASRLSPFSSLIPDVYNDTLNSNDTTIITVSVNTHNLNAGVYNFSIEINNNDTSQTVIPINFELTVTGNPEMVISDTCLHFGPIIQFTSITDSLLFSNSGCDTLNFTSVTSTESQFVPGLSNFSLAPRDSVWLPVTFYPDTHMVFNASLVLINNQQDTTVCLIGTGTPSAEILGLPDSILASATCHNLMSIPITIYNEGELPLIIEFAGVDSANVLAFTYGVDYGNEYTNTMNAIRETFDGFRLTELNTTNSTILQNALVGKDVFYMAEPELGTPASYLPLSPVLQTFVNNGGKAVLHGASYNRIDCMFNTGLITGSFGGTLSTQQVNVAPAPHPISDSLLPNFPAALFTYSLDVTSPGFVKVVTDNSNRLIAGYGSFGNGTVVYTGFDYDTSNPMTTKLAGNIMKWVAGEPLQPWLTLSSALDTISPHDSVTITVTFDATGLAAGNYFETIEINTNDPRFPIIYVPCTFTVSGLPEIALSDTCIDYGNSWINIPSIDSVQVFNHGCDSLFINNISVTTPYSTNISSLVVAPFDSAWIYITCLATAPGTFNATLFMESNAIDTSICLTTYSTIQPIALNIPSDINVNIGCSEVVPVPVTIYNVGGSTLTIDPNNLPTTGPLKVVAYTYGVDTIDEYPKTLNAINSGFTNYTVVTANTTSSIVLQSYLNNADVLLFPEFETGNVAVHTSMAGVIQSFTATGGKVIFCGSSANNSLSWFNTGIISGTYGGIMNGSSLTINGFHPILNNLSAPIIAPNLSIGLNITNQGVIPLLSSSGIDIVATWQYLNGHVVYVGFDYFTTNANASEIIANTMKWFSGSTMPEWVDISLQSQTISPGDSVNFIIYLHSDSLQGGSYNTNFTINTNDPSNPVIIVPILINVTQSPCPSYTFDFISCSGDVQFTSQTTNPATSYIWYFGDGDTSSTASPSHNYSASGSYVVSLVACNAFGCDSISMLLNVQLPALTSANCIPQTQNTCCGIGIVEFNFANLSNTSQNATAGYENFTCLSPALVTEGIQYPISIYNGSAINENVIVWIDYNNDGSFSIGEQVYSGLAATVHTGSVTIATNAVLSTPLRIRVGSESSSLPPLNSCSNPVEGQFEDYSIIISPFASPVAQFSIANIDTCDGLIEFTDISTNLPTSWLWDFGDGNTATTPTVQHQYASSGNYNVTLTVSNAAGSDFISIPVTVQVIQASIAITGAVLAGSPIQFDSPEPDNVSWQWFFGDGNSSLQQNPSHSYTSAGMFVVSLTVVDARGCTTTVDTTISVLTGIYEAFGEPVIYVAPNPFTGETNLVIITSDAKDVSISMYNTLGERVFVKEKSLILSGTHQIKLISPASGLYFVRVELGDITRTIRIVNLE